MKMIFQMLWICWMILCQKILLQREKPSLRSLIIFQSLISLYNKYRKTQFFAKDYLSLTRENQKLEANGSRKGLILLWLTPEEEILLVVLNSKLRNLSSLYFLQFSNPSRPPHLRPPGARSRPQHHCLQVKKRFVLKKKNAKGISKFLQFSSQLLKGQLIIPKRKQLWLLCVVSTKEIKRKKLYLLIVKGNLISLKNFCWERDPKEIFA